MSSAGTRNLDHVLRGVDEFQPIAGNVPDDNFEEAAADAAPSFA